MLILEQKIERFISTNMTQPYDEWDENTEYAWNTTVVYSNHIYRNIVKENKGVEPDLNTGKWLLFGVDNAFAMLDLHSHTDTIMDKGLPYIETVFTAVGFDYIGFGNVRGSTVDITEYASNGTEIRTKTHKIGNVRTCAITWHDYYYCGIPDQLDLGKGKAIDFLHGSISPDTAKIRVRINKNSDDIASCGSMIGGKAKDIGNTQFGVNIRLVDYSIKERDNYGITSIERRDSQEVFTCDITFPAKHTQIIKREVKANLGKVVMIIAEPEKDSNYDNLITLGYIEDFQININNGIESIASMKILEVL